MKKLLSKIAIAGLLLYTSLFTANAAIMQGYQGGTGYGTSTAGTVGQVLTVASTSPWLTYSFTTPAGTAVVGTANQIIATTTGATTTLSTPQNIATSSAVQFATTTLATTSIQQLTISSLEGILAGLQGLIRTINLVSPLSYSTTTNNLSISQANTSTNGYLSSTDWNTFNTKVSSTTQVIAGTGMSGGGALSGNVTLNNNGVLSITASSSVGISSATGTVNIGAKNYPIQWIIENPTASENDGVFIFNATSTLSKVVAVNKTAGDTVTFGFGYAPSMATATSSINQLFSTAQTLTSTTTPTVFTINASSTPNTGDILRFWTTAASSTQSIFSLFYSEN